MEFSSFMIQIDTVYLDRIAFSLAIARTAGSCPGSCPDRATASPCQFQSPMHGGSGEQTKTELKGQSEIILPMIS
jgi:hypothetical protein